MKRILALILAALMVFAMVACTGNTPGGTTTTAPDAGTTAPEGDVTPSAEGAKISVCLASEPATIDPALNSSVDGATMVIHAFTGLVGYRQDANGALELYPACATELPTAVIGEDGKATYTFTLRDGLKWSDGSDLTAEDFIYAWNRAVLPATASDYAYMFDVIDGYFNYVENTEGTGGYDLVNGAYVDAPADDEGNTHGAYDFSPALNVTADGNKITIVLRNDVPYFYELLAFPTYMPVKKDIIEANPDGWATDPATYIGNGPYVMSSWDHDSKIVYTKNPNYYAADTITCDEISFYLSDDESNMLANFKNGEWLFIDNVPTDEIKALEVDYPDEYFVTGQLGTYYVIFNVNKDLLPASSTLTGVEKEAAEQEIRQALSLLFDRNYIVEEIGQAGQLPASSYVAMGLTDSDNKTEFYHNAGNFEANGYYGYYNTAADAFESNFAAAIEILKKYYTYDEATSKFTDIPTLDYLYNTSDGHKAIAEYLQQALAVVGINMTITNQEWNTFLETRKQGNYNIARNGWLADYNDPMSFLDMWLTASGNNDAQFGRDDHGTLAMFNLDLTDLGIDYKVENGTWAETYDYVINLIKTTTDVATRYSLMHKAEDLLMSTGAIVPLYYYTDIFMCSAKLKGTFSSPLGYKFFMYSTVTD